MKGIVLHLFCIKDRPKHHDVTQYKILGFITGFNKYKPCEYFTTQDFPIQEVCTQAYQIIDNIFILSKLYNKQRPCILSNRTGELNPPFLYLYISNEEGLSYQFTQLFHHTVHTILVSTLFFLLIKLLSIHSNCLCNIHVCSRFVISCYSCHAFPSPPNVSYKV